MKLILTIAFAIALLLTACAANEVDEKEWVPKTEYDKLAKEKQNFKIEYDKLTQEKQSLQAEYDTLAKETQKLSAQNDKYENELAHEETLRYENPDNAYGQCVRMPNSGPLTISKIFRLNITFQGTINDFEQIFGIESLPSAKSNEMVRTKWRAVGVPLDMDALGVKIVMARHSLLFGSQKGFDFEKFLTIELVSKEGKKYPMLPSTIKELPALDLALLDAPAELPPIHALRPASIESCEQAFHVFQPVKDSQEKYQIQIVRNYGNNNGSKNFLSISGRFIPGDSGTPLVVIENGEAKILAFVVTRSLTLSGGGYAARADRLMEELSN